jgi:hypothetical protein
VLLVFLAGATILALCPRGHPRGPLILRVAGAFSLRRLVCCAGLEEGGTNVA